MVGNHALHLLDIRYVGKGSGIVLTPILTRGVELRGEPYSHFTIADGFVDMGERVRN